MNALAQLMALAGNAESEHEAFAGYCTDCGRGTYKRGHVEAGRAAGWIQKATNGPVCMTCYQRKYRVAKGAKLRPTGLSVCVGCSRGMRGKREPKRPGVQVRQSYNLCTACYQKQTRDRWMESCTFTDCSVCGRQIGAAGAFGGNVRPGYGGQNQCESCYARLGRERRRRVAS